MNSDDASNLCADLSGQNLLRQFIRQAKAILKRGGLIDTIYQRISALPGEFVAAAQQMILGSLPEETTGTEILTPKERAIRKWRQGIAEFLSSMQLQPRPA